MAEPVPELKMPQPELLEAALSRVQIDALPGIAGDANIGHAWHVFEQPPGRRCGKHDALELREHRKAIARRRRSTCAREVRTRRAADDTIEAAGGRIERAHVAAIDQVRPANNTEALGLETPAEQVNAGE